MPHMLKTHAIEFFNMIVVEAIEDLTSRFAGADEAHLTQSAQLMRHGGLGHVQFFGKRADAHLAIEEQGDDPHAAGVAEGAEQFGELNGFEFGEFHIIEYLSKRSYITSGNKPCQVIGFAPLNVLRKSFVDQTFSTLLIKPNNTGIIQRPRRGQMILD